MRDVTTISASIDLDNEFADFEVREDLERQLEARIAAADVDIRPMLPAAAQDADDDQKALIHSRATTIRLVAPAGAGKTQTIINRVLALINAGAKPERILCLTFDNSAVGALREKVEAITTSSGILASHFQITTLNAFGFRILREHFPAEYRPVVERMRAIRLVRGCINDLKSSPEGRQRADAMPESLRSRFFVDYFSLLKNAMFDPRAFDAQELANFMLTNRSSEALFGPGSTTGQKKLVMQAAMWLFRHYNSLLSRDSLLDFDDQKLRAVQALQATSSVLTLLQARYDEIIVDEFQDINRLDFEFVKLLAANARLVVTGDDDQAIYGFRGCSPDYIINLDRHLGRQVESLELRRNYRCPRNVVDHATRLIGHNTTRIRKAPIAVRAEDATIKVVNATTATAEAKATAAIIERIRRRNSDLRCSDFAVLYRTNAQSLPIQLQFILRDIPYHVRDTDNILKNEELKKLLGALRTKMQVNAGRPVPSKDALLIIRAYFRYLPAAAERRLESFFRRELPFLELVGSTGFLDILPKARNSKFVEALHALFAATSLFKALDALATHFKGLRGMIGDLEDVIEGDVPLGEVYELAASFHGSIPAFVATVDTALKKAQEGNAGHVSDGVSLSTYFKAKGLQWHTVILTSCNDGLIPHKRAPLEDERRLFYVALTRSSSNLYVSYLKTSCRTKVSPSVFLKEAGLYG